MTRHRRIQCWFAGLLALLGILSGIMGGADPANIARIETDYGLFSKLMISVAVLHGSLLAQVIFGLFIIGLVTYVSFFPQQWYVALVLVLFSGIVGSVIDTVTVNLSTMGLDPPHAGRMLAFVCVFTLIYSAQVVFVVLMLSVIVKVSAMLIKYATMRGKTS